MDDVYSRKCPYLYRGVIEDNIDPMKLGRCRVRVPSIHGKLNYSVSALPWARPLVFSPVSAGKGSVNIPDVGDIVWVLFEGSAREFPVYFGGTYAKGELPIDKDKVVFYIEGDNRISYDRKSGEYEIAIGENKIQVSSGGISISGPTEFTGNVSVQGTLTVDKLVILESCNKEGEHN